jgi:hypothetical protein
MWESPYTSLLHPNEHGHNLDYGRGVHGSIGRKIPCHKERGIFLHMTLKHETKFEYLQEEKKGKTM